MVQQNVTFADGGENVLCTAGFDFGDLTVRGWDERAVLQIRTVDAAKLEQHGHIQRGRQTVDFVDADTQLVREQLGQERAGLVGDFQADRRPETTAQQLLFHGVEQVFGVVFLNVDVFVTGDTEGTCLLDDHAREQRFKVRDDEVLHGDEAITLLLGFLIGHVVHRNQAVEVVRDLHAGEVGLAAGRVLHQYGEVQRTTGNVGERVGRIHRERGEHGEHLLAVVAGETLLLLGGELIPAQQHHMFLGQRRQDVIDHVVGVLVLQGVRLVADGAQLLAWAQSGSGRNRDAGVDTAFETGHANHEELIEVIGEDRCEVGALQQRLILVLGKLQDSLVELQPAQFTVEETIGRQRCLAFQRLSSVVLVRLSDVLCNLTTQNRL